MELLILAALVLLVVIAVWLLNTRTDLGDDEVTERPHEMESTIAAAGDFRAAEVAAMDAASARASQGTTLKEVDLMQEHTTRLPGTGAGGTATAATGEPFTMPDRAPVTTAPADSSPAPSYGMGTDGYLAGDTTDERDRLPLRIFGISAGTLATLAAAVGGVWFYTRWQRERNRPINRLRRQARHLAHTVGERLPDTRAIQQHLPDAEVARPVGGASTALLLAALLAAQVMRRRRSDTVVDRASDALEQALHTSANGHSRFDGLRDRVVSRVSMPTLRVDEMRDMARDGATRFEPAARPVGIGLGGMLTLGAAAYLVWRAINRDDESRRGWHPEAARGEMVPNQ